MGKLSLLPANAPTHTPSCSSVCISSALALNRGNKRSDPLLYFRTLPYKPDFKDLIVAHAFTHGFCAVTIPGMKFLNQSVKTRGFRKTARLCGSAGRQAPQHIQFVMLATEACQFAALICASTLIVR